MEDGEAIQAHGPRIVIEFIADGSSIANVNIENCNYMQLFAAGKLIEIQGESAFMTAQVQQASKEELSKKIVVPRFQQ